ncbi:hypothetical protein AAFN75_16445 [Algibacter sp. AS12]|uniref:hypothetical protein n=1 Tax=Algibacter sp. AS12 TaxID=3135773 RepID=UPI00398AB4DD
MHQLYTKPFIYFWFASALTILTGYTLFTKIHSQKLVFNFQENYFVISNIEFNIFIGYILACIGLIYYIHSIFKITLFKYLTISHTLLTLGCLIVYFLSPMFLLGEKKNFPLFDNETSIDHFIIIIGSIATLVQLILISNSIISSIKCLRQKIKL